jgi:hypothetical protein
MIALFGELVQTGNAALLPILQDSHELARFLDSIPLKDIGLINLASYPDRVYTVEHQVLHLLSQNEFQPSSPLESPSTACIIKPLLHALLLHIYTNLRLSPVAPKIRGTLVARLYGCLNVTDLVARNQDFPAELVWVGSLGGTSAVAGSKERTWLKEQLRWMMIVNNWHEWEWDMIGEWLRSGLWLENGVLASCGVLWQEILKDK